MASPPKPQGPTIKVILVGNSGVGKSFLANVIVGDPQCFKHDLSHTSVTTAVEHETSHEDFGEAVLKVYNIPGLIESDEQNIERNKKCIKQAFMEDKHLPTMVLFIISGGVGGRVGANDLDAWKAISTFLQVEAKKYGAAITIVVNKVPLTKDKNKYDRYTTSCVRTLEGLCGKLDNPVLFLDDVPDEDHRADFTCEPMVKLQTKLLLNIRCNIPRAQPIVVDPNVVIELNGDVLKKQNEALHKQMIKMQEDFEKQRDSDTAEWRQALAKQREDNARSSALEREEWQRKFTGLQSEIAGYKDEIKKLESSKTQGEGGGLTLSLLTALLPALVAARDQAAPLAFGGAAPPQMMMMATPDMGLGSGPARGGRTMQSGTASTLPRNLTYNQVKSAYAKMHGRTSHGELSKAWQAYKAGKL